MAQLRAGDYVLAQAEHGGAPFADRLIVNLHARDARFYPMLTFSHSLGNITVTPNHVLVLADGTMLSASSVRVGQRMRALTDSGSARAEVEVSVQHISATSRQIINPLTHGATILAAGSAHEPAVLATTVLQSPDNVQVTIVRMPSLFKLNSWLFPEQMQASQRIEDSMLFVVWFSGTMPPWLCLCAFVLWDLIVGVCFLAWHSAGAVASAPGASAAVCAVSAAGVRLSNRA